MKPKTGKFKSRKTKEMYITPVDRAGSSVPEQQRKRDRRRAGKAAKQARKRSR